MPKTIGVAIIAKNEEALIARCLESVKDADQIVVCDTGSIDRTVEIAKKYTDEVYLDFVWCDDYAAAQNHCKSKMRTDWILSIDCDEYCHDFSEVRKAIELGKDMIRVHMIAEGGSRLEFGFGRLFRNSPDIYWVQPIHKHLNIPGEGEEIGNVKITFGWSPAHANDPDRALRILEKTVAAEKEPGRNLYYLGREYWYKRRYEECTNTLGRYIQISNWPAEKADAFLVMSQAYSAQGLDIDARDAILQAININSNFREAIEWMANISTPENSLQWKRMARTANNKDIMWDRVPAKPVHDVIFLSPHNDDETLFGAYTNIRHKPLVVIVTDSYIQPLRGDIGCTTEIRRYETIKAMNIAKCPVVFLGIKDTEITEEILRERLQGFNPETIYIPALQGGNPQHDLVNKVAMELFGRNKCEQYCTYTRTELYTTGGWEIKPTQQEIELKNRMLDCYKSQINLPSTAPHFLAVRNKSEWLV
jgi:glycosyltransferase involved in cell wall biosynthesis/LmbE family N-acetylglucosaminyl deacetylase